MDKTIDKIKTILDDKKATDIAVFDLSRQSYIVDTVVLCTSLNDKHAHSLIDSLKTDLKVDGEEFLRVDDGDGWIAIDMGDKLVHIMTDQFRQRYDMDQFLKDFGKKETNE